MRTLLALSFLLTACGGSDEKLPDFGAGLSICPADIASVQDGEACGEEDVKCGSCTPACGQPCVDLYCQNGAWLHVQENATCDGGTSISDGG